MQSTARKKQWPLDKMCLAADVTKKTREEITFPPREGSFVHGLFMEGKNCISEMFQARSRPSSALLPRAAEQCQQLLAGLGQPGCTWVQAEPPAEGSTARITQPFQTQICVLAIQAPAHKPQGSWSYRALVNTRHILS